MGDKLYDLWLQIVDFFQEVVWWIQDNLRTFLLVVGVLVGTIVFYFGYQNINSGEYEKLSYFSEEHLNYLDNTSDMVDKMFLNLDENSDYQIFGASNKSYQSVDDTIALEYNFYLRKPFTDENTIENTLTEFQEMVMLQTRANGLRLRMLTVNLFYRKDTFDQNLDPDGVYKYMLDYNKLDIKSLEQENKYQNMSVEDIARQETLDTNKVRYSNYRVYFQYEPLNIDVDSIAMTDEEFTTYLKIDKYVALMGGFAAGVKLYLNYELGANVDENSYINIVQQFEDFRKRLDEVGERVDYYSEGNNIWILFEDLVRNNPQILVFVRAGEVIQDPVEARALLMKEYADEFRQSLIDFADYQGSMYTEFNRVYEPASNNFINNLNNSQKIAKGLVKPNGVPMDNIDYDEYFRGNIDINGVEQDQTDEDTFDDTLENLEPSTNSTQGSDDTIQNSEEDLDEEFEDETLDSE